MGGAVKETVAETRLGCFGEWYGGWSMKFLSGDRTVDEVRVFEDLCCAVTVWMEHDNEPGWRNTESKYVKYIRGGDGPLADEELLKWE